MTPVPPARHLLRAKDLIDARYFEPLDVPMLARAARVAKGGGGGLFISTDDCRATYQELKSRGVEFTEEPTERPYGIDAAFRSLAAR